MSIDVNELRASIAALKAANDNLNLTKEPLSEKELDFLSGFWLGRREFGSGDSPFTDTEHAIRELLKFRSFPTTCGCLGARPGEPWCPCTIYAMMDAHRLDVALHIIDKGYSL